jgi:hypothetical protein
MQNSDDFSISSDYIDSSNSTPNTKKDKHLDLIKNTGTLLDEEIRKYGTSKPQRVIIRARITHGED